MDKQENVYQRQFLERFGVDVKKRPLGKAKSKWSKIVERQFTESGKAWNEDVKFEVKGWLSGFAADNCEIILIEALTGPLDAFITTAEMKLPEN